VASIHAATQEWAEAHMREIKFHEKGSGVLTEAYSAITEGVPGSSDQELAVNKELLEAILSADRVSDEC
jgi:NifU-like protein involved in Fe-S cluster formation